RLGRVELREVDVAPVPEPDRGDSVQPEADRGTPGRSERDLPSLDAGQASRHPGTVPEFDEREEDRDRSRAPFGGEDERDALREGLARLPERALEDEAVAVEAGERPVEMVEAPGRGEVEPVPPGRRREGIAGAAPGVPEVDPAPQVPDRHFEGAVPRPADREHVPLPRADRPVEEVAVRQLEERGRGGTGDRGRERRRREDLPALDRDRPGGGAEEESRPLEPRD